MPLGAWPSPHAPSYSGSFEPPGSSTIASGEGGRPVVEGTSRARVFTTRASMTHAGCLDGMAAARARTSKQVIVY